MKKQTMLLLVSIVMVNAVIAQQIDSRQKVTTYYPKAQEELPGMKMINHSGNLNLPSLCLNPSDQSLKSGSKIKLDSVVISTRSMDTEPWIKVNKLAYLYDNEFRLVKIVTTSGLYDYAGSPKIARFVYNAAGLVDSVQLFNKPDFQISDLTMYFKFIYDGSGRLYQSTNWDVSGGYLNFRNTYSYNESGKISEIFMEEDWWFYCTTYHRFSYNSEGKLIRYDAPGAYSMLATYEWNFDGNLIAENYSNWNQKRIHYFYYSPDGNRSKSELYFWQKSNNNQDLKLIEHNTEEYSYTDLNSFNLVNLNQSLLRITNELDEIGYSPKKLISTTTNYTMNYGSSVNYEKSVYYYSPLQFTAIHDEIIPDFSIFPNPASDHVTFSWQAGYGRLNLKIFQLSGACLLDREISSQETVRFGKMPKGIYLYKLSGKNQLLKTGKLIIE